MHVALVSVGDELLSGDTVNTNAAWLGERLTERGATVERATVVPDRVPDIARVVDEYRAEYDAVVVTGGLGPTHDDVTMAGVAAAVGRSLESNDEAHEWLTGEGGYAGEDLAAGTTELPAGARPLHNRVGVAPGCVVEDVYVLPGVPAEMEAMFEQVADEFTGEPRHTGVVAVDEPESELVDRFAVLQERFDVKVGSYPGETVRVKVESTDREAVDDAVAWLRAHTDHVDGGDHVEDRDHVDGGDHVEDRDHVDGGDQVEDRDHVDGGNHLEDGDHVDGRDAAGGTDGD